MVSWSLKLGAEEQRRSSRFSWSRCALALWKLFCYVNEKTLEYLVKNVDVCMPLSLERLQSPDIHERMPQELGDESVKWNESVAGCKERWA